MAGLDLSPDQLVIAVIAAAGRGQTSPLMRIRFAVASKITFFVYPSVIIISNSAGPDEQH